ncbi:MAG: sugar transferase [Planctomycetales bacterium]|nr:sugar transferase [Planctomycetales bacterium]
MLQPIGNAVLQSVSDTSCDQVYVTAVALGGSTDDSLSDNRLDDPLINVEIPNPPDWLRKLNLENARVNIQCLRWRTRLAKRITDIFVASSLLFLAWPLILLSALLIKLTSRGPIFFFQTRVGLNNRRQTVGVGDSKQGCRRMLPAFGRPFTIYKLRTMYLDDSRSEPRQVQSIDSRVTPVGRILRRLRIDELPQLINVLRGEMSMVGPRPECIEYMDELTAKVPDYGRRLGLKPGLTGIAQIESGYANDLQSYQRKIAFDLMYLQNCCWTNDLRILWRTVRVVLTGFGAL